MKLLKKLIRYLRNRNRQKPIIFDKVIDGHPIKINLTRLFGENNEPSDRQTERRFVDYYKQMKRGDE